MVKIAFYLWWPPRSSGPDGAFWTNSGRFGPSDQLFRGQKARFSNICRLNTVIRGNKNCFELPLPGEILGSFLVFSCNTATNKQSNATTHVIAHPCPVNVLTNFETLY